MSYKSIATILTALVNASSLISHERDEHLSLIADMNPDNDEPKPNTNEVSGNDTVEKNPQNTTKLK